MKAFNFTHASDLHLGYAQYGLEARRQDFDNAFTELVDKTIELKADFMVIAGDLFHQARPSNTTLENAIKNFKRLRDAEIPVLTVDGSHDSAPNTITGTILIPLDSAGLIHHLPRRKGACWRKTGCCYVYGIPNFRTRRKTDEALPQFINQNPPTPERHTANIFVLHTAVNIPNITPSYIEAETSPELIPEGFDYYAAGHVHTRYIGKFKTGLLAYSGCTETTTYDEAESQKGFFHVNVNEKGGFSTTFVELESPRKFIVLDHDFSGMNSAKITELAAKAIKDADTEGAVITSVIRGVLPVESSRSEIDVVRIRNSAEKALFVNPIIQLRESQVPEEIIRSIFDSDIKDLKTKAYEYFTQIFSEQYSRAQADRIARSALTLIENLTRKQEEKVKQIIEDLQQ